MFMYVFNLEQNLNGHPYHNTPIKSRECLYHKGTNIYSPYDQDRYHYDICVSCPNALVLADIGHTFKNIHLTLESDPQVEGCSTVNYQLRCKDRNLERVLWHVKSSTKCQFHILEKIICHLI